MSKASKSPTAKDDQLHRLTDIATEEVSLVDRAANKRKWIITKNETGDRTKMFETIDKNGETDMTKIAKGESSNVSTETVIELLTGLTKSLEDISSVTEVVKNFVDAATTAVEKGETPATPAVQEWGTTLGTVQKSLENLFAICPALSVTPNKTAEEVAAEKAAADKSEADRVAAEKAAADKVAADKAASDKAEADRVAAEKTSKLVATAKSLVEIATELNTPAAVSSLAEITKKLDSVYVSGGLMIDTYDIAALEKLCEAIVTVINSGGEEDMAKSAPLTLAEAASRISGIAKKLETATEVTADDSKGLKVAELLVKHVVKKLDVTTPVVTETPKNTVTKDDLTSLEGKIASLVSTAVSQAITPFSTELSSLKKENLELTTKLSKALSDGTDARSSSGEPGAGSSSIDESKLFPLDYNADKRK